MSKFLARERFGRPQVLAGFLLLAFLAQCAWLLVHGTQPLEIDSPQLFRVVEGLQQWSGDSVAGTPSVERLEAGTPTPPEIDRNDGFDPDHSPLWYLLASLPMLRWTGTAETGSFQYWGWLARAPYLIFGVLLGASLWYVARRLYGNAGGYIALALYCFSPAILRSSTLYSAQPEMGAAWGAFGAIFTAIAVAHTLYAPREVVVWNWRRILLLGISLALAIGSQFSTILILPLALLFMLFLAPGRRLAAITILLASTVVAALILLSSYRFSLREFAAGFAHAQLLPFVGSALGMKVTYRLLGTTLLRSGPAVLLLLFVSVVTYIAWPRTRYFGTTAPLIVWLIFLLIAAVSPHAPGLGFGLLA